MDVPLFLVPNDFFNPVILSNKIENTRFTWGRALYLQRWNIHVFPPSSVRKNIELVALKLERICQDFNKNAFITSWYRPESYNTIIGGSQQSMHMHGGAIDFYLEGESPNRTRELLVPKLEEYQIRLENRPNSSWCHIDIKNISETFGSRYFLP